MTLIWLTSSSPLSPIPLLCVMAYIIYYNFVDNITILLGFGRVFQELPCPPPKIHRQSLELYDTTHAVSKVDCMDTVRLHCHCLGVWMYQPGVWPCI